MKPMPVLTEDDRERFAKYIKFTPGCWTWTGQNRAADHAYCSIGGQNFLVHRLAYYLHHGVDPGEWLVLHECDNPLCVNPQHLKLGDQKDNMKDASERRRCGRAIPDQLGQQEILEALDPKENRVSLAKKLKVSVRHVTRLRATKKPILAKLLEAGWTAA